MQIRLVVSLAMLLTLILACESSMEPRTSREFRPSYVTQYDSAVAEAGWTGSEHHFAMQDGMSRIQALVFADTASPGNMTDAAYAACVASAQRRGISGDECVAVYNIVSGGGEMSERNSDPGEDPPFGWTWDYFAGIEDAVEWMSAAQLDNYLENVETAALVNEGYEGSLPVFAVASLARSSAYEWEACDWKCVGLLRQVPFPHRRILKADVSGAIGGALAGACAGGVGVVPGGAIGGIGTSAGELVLVAGEILGWW